MYAGGTPVGNSGKGHTMTKSTTTKTSPGYSSGDTVRRVFTGGREVSRAYQTSDGKTHEYKLKAGGGFSGSFIKKK